MEEMDETWEAKQGRWGRGGKERCVDVNGLWWFCFFLFLMILVVASHKLRPGVCRFNLPPELSLHHGQLQQRQHREAVVPHTPHLPAAAQHCHRSAVGEDHWKHRCQSRASRAEPLWNPHFDALDECVSADTAMVPGSPPLLCGKVSRDIKQELDKLSIDIRAKKLRWFSECISVITCSALRWDFFDTFSHLEVVSQRVPSLVHWWLGRFQHLRRASNLKRCVRLLRDKLVSV